MSISIRDQKILNEFSKTQPALQRTGEPPANVNLKIGDAFVIATSMSTFMFQYSFAKNGAIGLATPYDFTQMPVGAIITSVTMEVISPIVQGTPASLIVSITNTAGTGVAVVVISTTTDFSTVGIKNYPLSGGVSKGTAAQKCISLGSTQPNTAGIANFYISYINPVQLPK